MWAVLKVNTNELNLLKEDLKKKLEFNFIIYAPKVTFNTFDRNSIKRKREEYLLGDYIFCFSKKFEDINFLKIIQFSRGLKKIIEGTRTSQSDIIKFINRCRSHETNSGFVSLNFYEIKENKKYKFESGAFSSQIFEVLRVQKNKIKLLMGNLKISLNKEKYLFNPQ